MTDGYGDWTEKIALAAAAESGKPDFVYRPATCQKGSARREIGDHLILLGHQLVVVNVILLACMPVLRNFYAHRNEGTATKAKGVARSYALNPQLRPSEFLCTRLPGRPQTLLADWIDELRTIMQGMVT